MPEATAKPRTTGDLCVAIAGGGTVAWFAGIFWGNGWLYEGWPAPPNWIADLLEADGEGVYDAMYLQLSLIALLPAALSVDFFRRTVGRLGRCVAAFGAGVLPALIALALLGEAANVAIVADTETLDSYHFGSEAMRHHGGWEYRSRWTYVFSNFAYGSIALALALSCFQEGRRITSP